ncbi:MAG: hypothetical protein H8E44_16390 [Planctomycetes bacterium]|nr:hypothetical protein [Planctomycetota bacterium]
MNWRSVLILGVILSIAASAPLTIQAVDSPENADAPIELEPGRKQLFLDDFAVQSMKGLRRTMHQPEKRGPVFRPDGPADGIRVQTASAPVWVPDEGVYKLFYMAFPYRNGNWVVDEIGCALAVSKDGLHWERPVLNQVEIGGSTRNNRFYVVHSEARWTANSFMDVVYDPRDPDPNRRYKGLLGASGRDPVVSPDCVHWTQLDAPRIPSSDTSSLIYDELAKRYIATVKIGTKYGRSAAVTFSKDFETWTKPRLSFQTDAADQVLARKRIRQRLDDPGMQNPMFNEPDPDTGWKPPTGTPHIPTWRAETYRLSVFPYEGLYVGLPMIYYPTGQALPQRNNTVGFQEIQLVFTRDPELRIENWVRVGERKPFIETSRLDKGLVGNFDRQQIAPLNRPLIVGDELWFYYIGAKGRTPPYKMWRDGTVRNQKDLTPQERADFDDGWIAVCLAVLRLDGFVSLDAGEEGGYVLTKPLRLHGKQLLLNLDAGETGSATVQALNGSGEPIAVSHPVTGNGVRLPLSWRQNADLKSLAHGTIQFRIHLNSANLYAFWIE